MNTLHYKTSIKLQEYRSSHENYFWYSLQWLSTIVPTFFWSYIEVNKSLKIEGLELYGDDWFEIGDLVCNF